jgi:hypothetical protein
LAVTLMSALRATDMPWGRLSRSFVGWVTHWLFFPPGCPRFCLWASFSPCGMSVPAGHFLGIQPKYYFWGPPAKFQGNFSHN